MAPSPSHVYRCLRLLILSTFLASTSSLSSSPSTKPLSFGAQLLLQQNGASIEGSLGGVDGGNHEWEYWCESCSCGFNKRKSYSEHLAGKRHASIIAEEATLWEAYQRSGPCFYDASVTRNEATRAWSLDIFMEGLQARSRSNIQSFVTKSTTVGGDGRQIDPSLKLHNLPPSKKAALWRMLYTSDVPKLAEMIAALPPHYVRAKELLESTEVFLQIQQLMTRSTVNGKKPKRVHHMYDVGCGHGLVGMLCAATFPEITVHAIDLVPRDSFLAQQHAFRSVGIPLVNLKFEAGDLSVLEKIQGNESGDVERHSLLLCVHGCKNLTHESIELALRKRWTWLSLPCCLQSDDHLENAVSLKVDDKTRFAMLCGVMAAKYHADTVSSIDARITARGIVLASSL